MLILDGQLKHNVKTEAFYYAYVAIYVIDFIVSPMKYFPSYKKDYFSILSLNFKRPLDCNSLYSVPYNLSGIEILSGG